MFSHTPLRSNLTPNVSGVSIIKAESLIKVLLFRESATSPMDKSTRNKALACSTQRMIRQSYESRTRYTNCSE